MGINTAAAIYIQARMGAVRLPGKPLKTVLGKPLLEYMIERLRLSQAASIIVVATTDSPQDEPIVNFAKKQNVEFFRGSETDVLDRYYQTSLHFPAETIVRVTADCPLLDPQVVDDAVRMYQQNYPAYDYVSNTLQRKFPRGMDVEVFSLNSLREAAKNARLPGEREHVTPYIYGNTDRFNIGQLLYETDESQYRWCVDTPEDFNLVSKIIEDLYPKDPHFTLKDILNLIRKHPDWSALNAHIEQKKWNK